MRDKRETREKKGGREEEGRGAGRQRHAEMERDRVEAKAGERGG